MAHRLIHPLVLPLLAAMLLAAPARGFDEPRLLVLTDIGGDPDDQQSLIRLLLYANEFELEGVVASASGSPGELAVAVTKPHLVRELVEAYRQVHPQLTNHAAGFPRPDELLARIKSGNPDRGRAALGAGRDTEGSRFIVELVDRPDPRPLNISIWGGQTDFAQACLSVRTERGPEALTKFLAHVRVYDINDQDELAEWIMAEFAPPFYVLAHRHPGHDKREGAYRGMYLGGDESLVAREWMEVNIRNGHGPLGALYPSRTWTDPNPHSAIKEGDTPSWFFFLSRGLTDPNFPNWGGWGGRFEQSTNGVWRDAKDTVGGITDARSTVSRWRPAFQNDFAARLDWCVKPFGEANHAPQPIVNGNLGRDVLRLSAKPGALVRLDATQSIDPDGDRMSYRWWQYWEAGTWSGDLGLRDANQPVVEFRAPDSPERRTIHLILEATDSGQPALTGYRRVVVQLE